MSLIKAVIRFVLAFVGMFALLQPFPILVIPPDPFDGLIVSGVVAVVALPVAAVFVRRSRSLERLYGFLLGVYVLTFAGSLLVAGISTAVATISSTVMQTPSSSTLFQFVFLLVGYALAFHLVYRGGYARLKTSLA